MLQDVGPEECLGCPYTNGSPRCAGFPIERIKDLCDVSTNSDEHLILDLRRCQVPDGTTHQLDGFRSMMSIEEGDALQLAQIMEVAKDARLHNHDV